MTERKRKWCSGKSHPLTSDGKLCSGKGLKLTSDNKGLYLTTDGRGLYMSKLFYRHSLYPKRDRK